MEAEMKVKCIYQDSTYYGNKKVYVCKFFEQSIPENTTIIPDGKHESARGNEHVESVQFIACSLTKVPQGLTRIFPNLKVLDIFESGLKTITKSDLAEYKNLERIYIEHNKIKFLPGDLFEGFKNLEAIGFRHNNIEVIESNILDGLDKLKYVNFSCNPNYTKCYSQFSDYSPNATLEEVKDELMVIFCKDPKTINDLLKVKEENMNLKDKNAELNADNQNLKHEIDELNAEVKNLKEEVDDVNAKVRNLEGQVDDVNAQNQKLQSENRKFKNFLTDETFKDFQIQIGDHKFAVHKFLIAARSPTLAEILKNNPGLENLKMVDIPVGIFEVILKYFYTDELPGVDGMNILHLYATAGKLKIEELKEYAATKIIQSLDSKNPHEVLKLSNKYNHDEMRYQAYEALKKKYPDVNFRPELAVDNDQLDALMSQIKRKEEADRKMEEMFNN
ncbi:uncharacterized protein [Chironomus tepperi]|uniref:uncharacterized protein n=1 Tax=Chironomus tepperi TaxID=113505 RepID=UPI00391F5D1F